MEKKKRINFCDDFCIIGFPDDLGIQNVQGRVGAKDGPDAFLRIFNKMNGKFPLRDKMRSPQIVKMGPDLENNLVNSAELVSSISQKSLIVALGGGHDYAYPWIKGLNSSKLGCINLDAHFDLRPFQPKMTSGSPFRRLIEEGVLDPKKLVEFGIQDHCNLADLWDYSKKMKIRTVPMTQLRQGQAVRKFKEELIRLKKVCDQIVLSVDLDALSLAYCPGVSAPQAEGFSAGELIQMLEIAGADKKVTSLGIFELSPPLDLNDQTARVAAQAAWHFLEKKFF